MRLLSIDPSIVNIGIAILIDGHYDSSHTFHTKSSQPFSDRLQAIQGHILSVLQDPPDIALIEYPDAFVRFGRRAILNIPSLQMLHVTIGLIFGSISLQSKCQIHFVKVSEWKGREPKESTQAIAKYLAKKDLNTHESDALVMGMRWAKTQSIKARRQA